MALTHLHFLTTLLHFSTQEDGAMPGKSLSTLQWVSYFILTPIALFSVITIIVIIATADRSKVKKSDLSTFN